MTVGEVRRHYEAEPFQTVRHAHGRRSATCRSCIASSWPCRPADARWWFINRMSSFDIVDLLLVTDLKVGLPPRNGRKRGSRG